MSYLTLEVEIDHGHITVHEPAKLPQRGKGLLTVLETSEHDHAVPPMEPLEALEVLQRHLLLNEAQATKWMATVHEARR